MTPLNEWLYSLSVGNNIIVNIGHAEGIVMRSFVSTVTRITRNRITVLGPMGGAKLTVDRRTGEIHDPASGTGYIEPITPEAVQAILSGKEES